MGGTFLDASVSGFDALGGLREGASGTGGGGSLEDASISRLDAVILSKCWAVSGLGGSFLDASVSRFDALGGLD